MLSERRHEVSRLEAFSDAAFAFALTLLVVSLDVPKSYDELMRTMRGFPSFACCFALLVWIWHEHNLFFRRYGLQDAWTVFVNSMLLFVTLFYVYPLKFMFDSMFAQFMPAAYPELKRMSLLELSRASAIYGLGFLILFSLFALLYRHAYNKRSDLGLTPLEVFDARAFAGHHLVSATVGFVALAIAVGGPLMMAPLSPTCFALMGPGHWWFGTRVGKRRRALAGADAAQR
jgi:hypothetical protein